MKVLFVCRLMSGFESSIAEGVWRPTGGPAIAGMIRALECDSDVDLSIIMTRSYDATSRRSKVTSGVKFLNGLRLPVAVLNLEPPLFLPKKLGFYWVEIFHLISVLRQARDYKPDLIYMDRSNWLLAGILSRILDVPVFLRLLGVPPDMWGIGGKGSLRHFVMRWAFRGPFAYVLCSRDGSPGRKWMEQFLSPEVPRAVMLNGVDQDVLEKCRTQTCTAVSGKVVFLGRLEELKGADLFVRALLSIPATLRGKVQPILIGDGGLLEELVGDVNQAGCGDWIKFTGAIPPHEVAKHLSEADLMVSLNKQGHLTNANLEAISHGLPILIQAVNSPIGEDGDLGAVLPKAAFRMVSNDVTPESLGAAILEMLSDEIELGKMRNLIFQARDRSLSSWSVRLENEVQLMLDVMYRKKKIVLK